MTSARILVADDQPAVLEALRWLLRTEGAESSGSPTGSGGPGGYDAQFVASTEAVMDRLHHGSYDLLLMDLNYSRDTTSGGEGLALIRRVRQHDATLPIVVMTGWGSIDTAVEAMRLGAKSFVQKPWDDAMLRDIVAREINDGRSVRRRGREQDREREEARLIQQSLLPSALPATGGVRMAASWQPADGVGGDCFDAIADGSRVGITIADVAGKGLPAALLMSNLQAAVRAFAMGGAEPSILCRNVNNLLCRHMISGRFVSFCFTWIDVSRSSLTYANAGHNPPLLLRRNGSVSRLSEGGMVMGVFADTPFRQAELDLTPGDRLLLYTDGVTEALNTDGEEFGEDRLVKAAQACLDAPADIVKDRVLQCLTQFTDGACPPLTDDATLIVVEV